ncbi:HEPN domain-containing protein [candidate division WOR-3 bacterium]|nr:HEPN domain-containing protein [candidate division WOR-3 bacterium]
MSELVSLRLEQARETLADARTLLEASRTPRSIVNRAYYAMFHAVLALLQNVGMASSKHAGVISLFDKEFVHSGAFPTEMSRSLHRAFDERHESDYETIKTTTREDAVELLAEAEQFV